MGTRLATFAAALLVATSLTRLALAEGDCAGSYEKAQEERRAKHLLAAREQMLVCAQDACPGFIKSDCAKWLDELETQIPTVVFAARHGDQELTEVKVLLGDEVVAASLDGTAIRLDPGPKQFVFEHAEYGRVEHQAVVKEGRQSQEVAVTFVDATTGAAAVDMGTPSAREKGSLVPAFIFTGVGVAGLGSFAFFGLSGQKEYKDLEEECSPDCTDADVEGVRTKRLIADVSLGVGVVSLGVATYLFVSPPGRGKAKSGARQRWFALDAGPLPGGGYTTVSGRF